MRVVTVGMDRMNFLFPIYVGELVTFSATVNAAWHTSMEVGVRVDAENPRTGEVRHTNTAYFTMVALDDAGQARPRSRRRRRPHPTEQRRMREAELRRSQPARRARADRRPPRRRADRAPERPAGSLTSRLAMRLIAVPATILACAALAACGGGLRS